MRIAAHMLGYGVDRFLAECVATMLPHIDKLFIGYSKTPFLYNGAARQTETNPTPRTAFADLGVGDKLEIIDGDWATEEEARNACLEAARRQGFDWLLVIDADEFYSLQSWEQLRRLLGASSAYEHIITTWYNFYKSSHYVLVERDGGIKSTNAAFAVRCAGSVRFRDRRLPTAARLRILDCPCHHYGYVMSDAEMLTKINTWSHAADFDRMRWYDLKWRHWTIATRNLHPVSPTIWRKAIRFPLPQPDFAHNFAVEVPDAPPRSLGTRIRDAAYDLGAEGLVIGRDAKAALRPFRSRTTFSCL